jgi:hypothetical protein
VIIFRTNLDYLEVPDYNSAILPPLGARVICSYKSKKVPLEVCRQTFVEGVWEVELTLPSGLNTSIKDWYKDYLGILL